MKRIFLCLLLLFWIASCAPNKEEQTESQNELKEEIGEQNNRNNPQRVEVEKDTNSKANDHDNKVSDHELEKLKKNLKNN